MKPIDCKKVTISGRVAVALLAAEHVSQLFTADTCDLIRAMIAAGWSWMTTRKPDPSQLYDRFNESLIEHEQRFVDDEHLLTAYHACLDAHYYLVWKAQGVASVEEPGVVYPVGSDIPEVDESDLMNCLERTIKASRRPNETESWLDGIIAFVERECAVTGGDVIGKPLSRQQFTVPPIT